MRYSDTEMYEYGKLLTERFPSLRLSSRSVGWSVNRGMLKVSMDLDSNAMAVAWMDGFHKGADEREAQIRAAVSGIARDYLATGDVDKLLAILTTWLPA